MDGRTDTGNNNTKLASGNKSIIASWCKRNILTSFPWIMHIKGHVLSRNIQFFKPLCRYKCCMIRYRPSLPALVQQNRWSKFCRYSPAFRPGLPPCPSSWIPIFLVSPSQPLSTRSKLVGRPHELRPRPLAWCCQPHRMGHGQHLNLKWIWMNGDLFFCSWQ